MSELPILNIEQWRAGTDTERRTIADELDSALQEFGFLLIRDHGLDEDLASRVRAEARRFFALDDGTKDNYSSRVGGRGWIPPGAEANSYASGVSAPPDMKETYKIGMAAPGDPDITRPDRWPAEVPDLQHLVRAYLEGAWALAMDMFTLFEQALGVPAGTFTLHASAAASSFNINYYPSLRTTGPPAEGQFRIGAHSDFGMLTILDRQTGYGALQIQTLAGEWIDAPDVSGALTVNIGDMLARWTGDRWRSTVHRVLPPSDHDADEELLSLINFCGVRPDTTLNTLPVGGPTHYEPVRAGDYLRAKIDSIDMLAE
ncbi:isopenicillin N synthase family dioxygenase [Nocardia sp. NPDC058658]|uniref:isopenicillin N synthase family dioxygenase n=1 Tax=Nocardia sp. NPDC058658 TaxID=3346580 RepID=UPI0036595628